MNWVGVGNNRNGPGRDHVGWDPKENVFYISRMGKPAFKFER
jgi:hypothetical protein